jgi:photosystem II stability/assembly factor-like uncharacterized protein
LTASHPSPTGATSRFRRTIRTRSCLSVAASSKDGALYRSQDVGKTWQRFDKVTPHGTLMSVGLHHGDAKQVYVAARYGEVFGTQDGGDSWLEMPLPQGVQHIYAPSCG